MPSFGTAYERFPVEPGRVTRLPRASFLCGDTLASDLASLTEGPVDVIYTDPPWDMRILNTFNRLAGRVTPYAFDLFLSRLVKAWKAACPEGLCFAEMGYRNAPQMQEIIKGYGGALLGTVGTLYGKDGKATLTAFTFGPQRPVLPLQEGLRGPAVIQMVTDFIRPDQRVLDPCCGIGDFIIPAWRKGATIYGVELLPRKLANAIERVTLASE